MNPYILGFVALVAIGIVMDVYIKGRSDGLATADAKWLAVEAERTTAAAAVLKAAQDRYNASEAANEATRHQWETTDHERSQKIDGLRIANGRLVAAAGGLFDRNGRAVGQRGDGAATAAPGAAGEAAAGAACGKLSAELEGLLLSESARADAAAIYAQLGHDYAVAVQAWRDANRP